MRFLGGDLGIISEVCALRGLQEELAVHAPEDPRRVFGAAVEVASGSSGATGAGLAQMFSALQERLTGEINERFTAYAREQAEALARIQERLDEDRTRVNLNVRAPKRAAPYQPQIARDLSGVGRPFPVSRFLDEKEREDPTWAAARRSFAPAFSLTVQVVEGSAQTSLPGSAAFAASDWGFGSPPRGEGLRIFCPLSGAQEEEAQGRGQSRGLR